MSKHTVKLAPSLLAADFTRLGEQVAAAEPTSEANHWELATRVKVLVVVEDLKGWEGGGD